jgi:DNA polymerase III gamma/tau subunit
MARLMDAVLGHDILKEKLLSQTMQKVFFKSVIFSGPEGIGKKQLAKALLQELNCQSSTACGTCDSCLKVLTSKELFLHEVELQNDKVKIESIRDMIQFTSLTSWVRHRFVVINHVERMTLQAANAVLKTLEEPPEGVHFVLITSNLSQVLPTIRSRCQVMGFSPLSAELLQKLVPGIEPWQIHWSFGRASLAKKMTQEEWQVVRQSAINFLHSSQNKAAFEELQSCLAQPESAEFVIHAWMTYLRDAYILRPENERRSEQVIYNEDIRTFAQKFSENRNIPALMDEVFQFRQDWQANVDKHLLLDQFSIRLESHATN